MNLAADRILEYAKLFGRPGVLEESVQRNLMANGATIALHEITMAIPYGRTISTKKVHELLKQQQAAIDAITKEPK